MVVPRRYGVDCSYTVASCHLHRRTSRTVGRCGPPRPGRCAAASSRGVRNMMLQKQQQQQQAAGIRRSARTGSATRCRAASQICCKSDRKSHPTYNAASCSGLAWCWAHWLPMHSAMIGAARPLHGALQHCWATHALARLAKHGCFVPRTHALPVSGLPRRQVAIERCSGCKWNSLVKLLWPGRGHLTRQDESGRRRARAVLNSLQNACDAQCQM